MCQSDARLIPTKRCQDTPPLPASLCGMSAREEKPPDLFLHLLNILLNKAAREWKEKVKAEKETSGMSNLAKPDCPKTRRLRRLTQPSESLRLCQWNFQRWERYRTACTHWDDSEITRGSLTTRHIRYVWFYPKLIWEPKVSAEHIYLRVRKIRVRLWAVCTASGGSQAPHVRIFHPQLMDFTCSKLMWTFEESSRIILLSVSVFSKHLKTNKLWFFPGMGMTSTGQSKGDYSSLIVKRAKRHIRFSSNLSWLLISWGFVADQDHSVPQHYRCETRQQL